MEVNEKGELMCLTEANLRRKFVMDRVTIVNQIGITLKSNCENCSIRGGATERELRAKGMFAKADRFCLKECPIGQELQALGTALDEHLKAQRVLRPRKRLGICEEDVG